MEPAPADPPRTMTSGTDAPPPRTTSGSDPPPRTTWATSRTRRTVLMIRMAATTSEAVTSGNRIWARAGAGTTRRVSAAVVIRRGDMGTALRVGLPAPPRTPRAGTGPVLV